MPTSRCTTGITGARRCRYRPEYRTENQELTVITAVTFDLWQTLILDNRELGLQRAQARLDGARETLLSHGVDYDPDHIREAYRGCYRACRAVRNDNKDVSFRRQVEIFIDLIEDGLSNRLPEPAVAVTLGAAGAAGGSIWSTTLIVRATETLAPWPSSTFAAKE